MWHNTAREGGGEGCSRGKRDLVVLCLVSWIGILCTPSTVLLFIRRVGTLRLVVAILAQGKSAVFSDPKKLALHCKSLERATAIPWVGYCEPGEQISPAQVAQGMRWTRARKAAAMDTPFKRVPRSQKRQIVQDFSRAKSTPECLRTPNGDIPGWQLRDGPQSLNSQPASPAKEQKTLGDALNTYTLTCPVP